MGFLSGTITYACYQVDGSKPRQFGPEHLKTLERFAIGQAASSSVEEAEVGFLAGGHLFDSAFDLEKNVIGEALHCAIRIDSNAIPAAIRRAWLQMELAALQSDDPGRRPTKAQRQEAKEAVAARCEEEARSGRYRRMQQFPVLWDAKTGHLFFGASSSGACEHGGDLLARAFDVELAPRSAGRRAMEWAAQAKRRKALEEILPTTFQGPAGPADIAWWNHEGGNFDFLGNEFLLWLWWRWSTDSDTIALPDDSEVTGMFARTLSLQCPRDESGKETITADSPTGLPEAVQGIRSGKLPRKAGLILVRHGEQYELVLQAETFLVSGARIVRDETDDDGEGRGAIEDRIESVRGLEETVDLLFRAFCQRRISKDWHGEQEKIRRWLKAGAAKS